MLTNVEILGKRVPRRGIVEYDALLGAHDVMDHRLRQRGGAQGRSPQPYHDVVGAGRGLGLDPLFTASRKNQETSLRSRVLDRGAHERVDQLVQPDFARQLFWKT